MLFQEKQFDRKESLCVIFRVSLPVVRGFETGQDMENYLNELPQ